MTQKWGPTWARPARLRGLGLTPQTTPGWRREGSHLACVWGRGRAHAGSTGPTGEKGTQAQPSVLLLPPQPGGGAEGPGTRPEPSPRVRNRELLLLGFEGVESRKGGGTQRLKALAGCPAWREEERGRGQAGSVERGPCLCRTRECHPWGAEIPQLCG